ncbi:Uncharacterised protein [Vibrio cholerae]|nr:Uncharacterised protein [Vibrio cholerae]CSI92824.1 Uncharacterised protein [Vibrio cholerae]
MFKTLLAKVLSLFVHRFDNAIGIADQLLVRL